MTIDTRLKSLLFILSILCFFACEDDDSSSMKTKFGIFELIDDNTVQMSGEINSLSLVNFNELIDSNPNVNLINMIEVSGSSDDEVNLQVSKKVHELNIAIHLMDNGLIASGGVDFFLAGVTRTKGINTQVGVHSWSDDTNEATDFPQGNSVHQPYIEYYESVGFTPANAAAFYYFTINAAPSTSIHWMTAAEIEQYGILKL